LPWTFPSIHIAGFESSAPFAPFVIVYTRISRFSKLCPITSWLTRAGNAASMRSRSP
jgi:hypothetical protein